MKEKNWWNKLEMWKKGAIIGAVGGGGGYFVVASILQFLWQSCTTMISDNSHFHRVYNSEFCEALCNFFGNLESILFLPYSLINPHGIEMPAIVAIFIIILGWGLIGILIGYLIGVLKK